MAKYIVNADGNPATHALVIGIGDYPHLADGTGPLAAQTWGLGQLTSPSVSAARFADWFATEYTNPDAPAGHLYCLISHGADVGRDTEEPNMGNITAAFTAWLADLDASPGNTAVFYFCGHGVEKGLDISLLASDFGAQAANPLQHAIDFSGMILGMEACQARNQVYFIDACRSSPPELLHFVSRYAGNPLILGTAVDVQQQARNFPVLYATSSGFQAWGRVNQLSRFTDALLRALAGAGADEQDGAWIVDTSSLTRALPRLLSWEERHGTNLPEQSAKSGGQDSGFPFHVLHEPPLVPVSIGCDPKAKNTEATFSLTPCAQPPSRGPQADDWRLDLPVAVYQVSAKADSWTLGPEPLVVFPPTREKAFRP